MRNSLADAGKWAPPNLSRKVRLKFRAALQLRLRIEAPAPSRYVTISAGCATAAPESPASLEALVEAADATLYRAKAAGRNLVVPAETMLPVRLA